MKHGIYFDFSDRRFDILKIGVHDMQHTDQKENALNSIFIHKYQGLIWDKAVKKIDCMKSSMIKNNLRGITMNKEDNINLTQALTLVSSNFLDFF